jgi:predicted amidohydrolase
MKYAVCQIEMRDLDIIHNASKIKEYIMRAKANQAAVVCFPEAALTGWATDKLEEIKGLDREIQEQVIEIQKLCIEQEINAIVGAMLVAQDKVINCALFFYATGGYTVVLKTKLTGYEFYGFLKPDISMNQVIKLDGGKTVLGIAICYDLESDDDLILQMKSQGATIIINCKHHRSGPGQWKPDAAQTFIEDITRKTSMYNIPIISINRAVETELVPMYYHQHFSFQSSHSMAVSEKGLVLKSSYPVAEDMFLVDF